MFVEIRQSLPSTTAILEDCMYELNWEGALEVYQMIPQEARRLLMGGVQQKPYFIKI